ncbi:acyltransferase family protein [Shewanella marina]|uniref:acyltransferase family protein n=1 Tax=Shewanella marina TaxID=487319 RepID=UPI000470DF72|nr:acyltransferase family protein [Shewanella marina]
MTFRSDINGLRAIAVIAVMLFHFNSSWLPGGFAGVDVFFVISGFLMTGIIFKGLENNNFSIINFYVARANRIIPALSVVCAVLLLFGWFYLTPLDYTVLGKHVISSMLFISNLTYWLESGYFDSASYEKWLLHTWSLSVEWQFYIIYPIVLVLLKKMLTMSSLKKLLLLSTIMIFLFSIYATYRFPNASYFLLPTRAWEMMLGGLAFIYPFKFKEKNKKYIEWFGILLIFSSYIVISNDTPWPGYLALIPVIGTYFVIIADRNASIITDNIIMRNIGKWSYSLYLWHWPIVVFGLYYGFNNWFLIGIPLSIVLGYLSYRYVERLRLSKDLNLSLKSILYFKPLLLVIMISGISWIVVIENGFDKRSKNNNYNMDVIVKKLAPNHGLSNVCENAFTLDSRCRTSDEPEILVWGDSFAMHIVQGIISSNKNVKLIQLTKSSCSPIFDIAPSKNGSFSADCIKFNDDVKNWVKDNKSVKYVVISSPFNSLFNENKKIRLRDGTDIVNRQVVVDKFYSTLKYFKDLGIDPVIILPPPVNGVNIGKCLDRATFFEQDLNVCDFTKKNIPLKQLEIYQWLLSLANDYKVIRTDKLICERNICITHIGNKFIYRDNEHLSYEGSRFLGRKYNLYKEITN